MISKEESFKFCEKHMHRNLPLLLMANEFVDLQLIESPVNAIVNDTLFFAWS